MWMSPGLTICPSVAGSMIVESVGVAFGMFGKPTTWMKSMQAAFPRLLPDQAPAVICCVARRKSLGIRGKSFQ